MTGYDQWKTEPPEPASPSKRLTLEVLDHLDQISSSLEEIERAWSGEDNLADISDILAMARRAVQKLYAHVDE